MALKGLLEGLLIIANYGRNKRFIKEAKNRREEVCQQAVVKYGINRNANLQYLQNEILNSPNLFTKLKVKNGDHISFYENERDAIINRKDEMLNRLSKLPILKMESLGQEVDEYLEKGNMDCNFEHLSQMIKKQMDNIINDRSNKIKSAYKGKHGEDYVSKQLELYQGKYRILENIVLPAKDSMGNTSEVDAYIITDKGIVVAEVKNFGDENQRLHITKDGGWYLEDIYSGRIINRIEKSPVEQNARHCLALERFLHQEYGANCNIPIIPVIFNGNKDVMVQNESRSIVLKVSEFYTFMNDLQSSSTLSISQQEDIERMLKKGDRGAQNVEVISRTGVVDNLERIEDIYSRYIKYNDEVIKENELINKKYAPYSSNILTIIPIIICLLGYIFIWKFDCTARFKIWLYIIYSILIIDLRIAVIAGVILFSFIVMR